MTKLRVLVLEGDLRDAERVELTLRSSGVEYELIRVESRSSFVTALAGDPVDLILADYILPDLAGMAALEMASCVWPEVPFIFVADSLGAEVAIAALEHGAAGFVLKQNLERLVPSMQRALRHAQQRRNQQQLELMVVEQQRRLEQSDAKYRCLYESIGKGFCVCELLFDDNGKPHDFRFLEVNPLFTELTGLDAAVGKTARELVPDLEAFWVETYGNVVQAGQAIRFERQSAVMNRWFDVHAFCIGEPQNHQFGILFTNISDRKHTEQERDRFLAIGSDLQVITGSNGYFQWVSPSFEHILGWTAEEMTSRPWTEFVHPDDINVSIAETDSLFSGSKTFRFENRYRHKDGSYRWLLWNAQSCSVKQVIYGTAIDITALKHTEAELHKNRAFLTHITDVAPIILYIYDLCEARNVWSNNNLFLVLGYTPDEVRAMGAEVIPQLLHPEDAQRYSVHFERLCSLQPEEVIEFEYRMRHKDGSWHWISSREMVYVRNDDGVVTQIIGAADDITERKRAEIGLQQREAELRLVTNTVPALIAFVDSNQRYRLINQAYEKWFGRSAAAICGQHLRDVLGEAAYQALHPYVEQVLSGQQVTFESQVPYRDGGPRYVNATYVPQCNSQGRVEGFVALISDISDRKQAEDRLRVLYETTSDLLATEQPLALMNALFSKLSARLDLHYYFNFLVAEQDNQRKLHLTHHSDIPEDIRAQIEWINFGQDICGMAAQSQRQVVLDQTQIATHPNAQLAHLLGITAYACQPLMVRGRLLGTLSFASLTRTYFTAEEAHLLQSVCEQMAIALERANLMTSIQQQAERLEEANRIKDEFLAVLSHELRSPLNPILGWTRLLQNGKLNATRQAEALATIERNARLQTQLIEDLLDISRIMRGKLTLAPAPVNLPFLISAAVETVQLAAEAKQIQIWLDLSPDVAPVFGDAARLQQVVWNLLTNAVKFTPTGGQVTVELRQLDQLAQIQVIDNGKGISPDFLPHVFEYFRQADATTTRRFGGLGLGLAIVRQIVEMHGGTVAVESLGENQGATFTVQLPIIQHAVPTVPEPVRANATVPADPLRQSRILLIDDDADTREFEAFLLKHSGARVTAVASGQDALNVLDQFIPDAIVSDIGMAEMDGYMLIEQIRSRASNQGGQIPAIALTAYARDLDQQKALQAGFQAYLTKPVEPEALVEAVVTLLNIATEPSFGA